MLHPTDYAKNYAGIMGAGLVRTIYMHLHNPVRIKAADFRSEFVIAISWQCFNKTRDSHYQ